MPYYHKCENGTLTTVLCLILLGTGIICTLLGGFCMIGGEYMMNEVSTTPEYIDSLKSMGFTSVSSQNMVTSTYKDMFLILGVLILIPGILTLVPAIMGFMHRGYYVGLVAMTIMLIPLIISLVMGYWVNIVAIAFGVLMIYLWTKCKYDLTSW